MTIIAIALGAVAISLAAALFFARSLGRSEAGEKDATEELEAIEAANKARNRLRCDADYAKRVRDTFTRG